MTTIENSPDCDTSNDLHDMPATGENYFCSVNLGQVSTKVVLYFSGDSALGHILQRLCREANYDCCLVHSQEKVVQLLKDPRHWTVLVVETYTSMQKSVSELTQHIRYLGLSDSTTLLAVINGSSQNNKLSRSLMDGLVKAGFSRVLTSDEAQLKLLWELRLIEGSEKSMKQQLLFSHVLFEAVEQTTDAVQVTGYDSKVMYVNRSFSNMSGFARDEVLGRPAVDILKCFNVEWENGTLLKKERFDGPCMGRRKSGSMIRQHLKLIPVQKSEDHVTHHLVMQRLLPSYESDHLKGTSPKHPSNGDGHGHPMLSKKQHSLATGPRYPSRLETPMTKAVQTLISARENPDCPTYIQVALDKLLDILRSSTELYLPAFSNYRTGHSTRGIVEGLLNIGQTGRRFTLGDVTALRAFPPQYQHHHLRHTPITPPPHQVQEALKNIDSWNFDVVALEEASGLEPLYYAGMKIFKQFDMCEVLDVDDAVLAQWFKLMESHYHHHPYHNSTHAADVLQATAYMVKGLQDHLTAQGEILEPLEVAAILIASAIHDLDHPGRTNPFLCNSEDDLALLYNDRAVLENHHIAMSFSLTKRNKQANIYQSLDTATYRTLRRSVIDQVLATDMSKHFEHLTKFTTNFVTDESSGSTTNLQKAASENRVVMSRIIIKCADICNPCRPWHLCEIWAHRVAQEYFSQTEEEKARGLPVVFPDFDRHTCEIPVTQVKFIDFFITGLFEAWHSFCPIPQMVDYLSSNYEVWKSKYDSPTTSEEEILSQLKLSQMYIRSRASIIVFRIQVPVGLHTCTVNFTPNFRAL